MKKLLTTIAIAGLLMGTLSACNTQADVVSENLSKAADEFEIERRVVVVNGITGDYLLLVEGLCALGNYDTPYSASIICLAGLDGNGEEVYKKHIVRMGDNVVVVAEQLEPATASTTRYRVVFRPTQIVPDVDVSTSDG